VTTAPYTRMVTS